MKCCTPQKANSRGPENCCTVSPSERVLTHCPECGGEGRPVDRITLKALLTPTALRRLDSDAYRFCPMLDCDVVYFAVDSVFHTGDLTVPVWQKSVDPTVFVCYCFEHSEKTIRDELAATRQTTALTEIKRLVKDGKCACEVRNPQGTCCLGNVSTVVKQVQSDQIGAVRKLAEEVKQ